MSSVLDWWWPVVETHSKNQSCFLQSKKSTFFANQTRFSCLPRSYSVLDEFCLPFLESSNNHHRKSCSSSVSFWGLRCIFLKRFRACQVRLKEFIHGRVWIGQGLGKTGFLQGGRQFTWWIGRCFHQEVRSFFIPRIFHRWEVSFHSRRQFWYFPPWFSWRFLDTKFRLWTQKIWNYKLIKSSYFFLSYSSKI